MLFFIIYSFTSQGTKYILPKTLDTIIKQNNPNGTQATLNNVLKISSTLGGFTSFLTGVLVESEYFQRLKLMKILIGISFSCSLLVLFSENYFIILSCIFKSILVMLDQVLEVYSSECVSTRRRVLFLSILNIIQSISIFTSPYVTDTFLRLDYKYNFVLFTSLLTVMIFISSLFKKEKYKSMVK